MLEELRQLLKHATIFGFGNVLGKVVGFLMIPFYTHYLVPAEYGTLELLDLTVAVVGLILNIWITGPVLRYYYDCEELGDRRRVVSTALIGAVVIASAVASIGYYLAPQIASLVLRSAGDFHYIRIISLSLFCSCLYSVGWSYLRARQQSKLLVILALTTLVISLSLNVYLIAFLHYGVAGMLIGSLAGVCTVSAYLVVHTFREVRFGFDWTKFRALVSFGAPLLFNSVAAFVLNFSDRFFLQHFSNLASVGVYALGYKFGYMLSFLVVQPFMLIWGARAYEVAKRERGNEYVGRIVEYFGLVLVAGALAISLAIREVITIIAAGQFREAYRVVPLIALAYVFQGFALYFQSGLLIEKRSGYVGAIGLASMTVNIAANVALIPRYHAMGAAFATAFTFASQAGLTFVASQRVYAAPYRLRRLCEPVLAGVAIYLLSTQVTISNMAGSLVMKVPVFLLFPLALLVMKFFDKKELDAICVLMSTLLRRGRIRAATASSN